MKLLLLILCAGLLSGVVPVQAALQSRFIEYQHGDKVLEGYLVYDDAVQGPRPGVLVVHEWWGRNDYVQMRADQLARLGYVAFALDMYGKGIRTQDPQEAGKLARPYTSDRILMRERAKAGLQVLEKQPMVDRKRLAAIGYCFGGTTVLELARSGAALSGVISFHGILGTPHPEDSKNIKAKVLILTGADDPNVPPDQVAAFENEMRQAGVDWYLVSYGNAVHAFSNPAAGNNPSQGAAYNEKADKRSWQAMLDFFREIF